MEWYKNEHHFAWFVQMDLFFFTLLWEDRNLPAVWAAVPKAQKKNKTDLIPRVKKWCKIRVGEDIWIFSEVFGMSAACLWLFKKIPDQAQGLEMKKKKERKKEGNVLERTAAYLNRNVQSASRMLFSSLSLSLGRRPGLAALCQRRGTGGITQQEVRQVPWALRQIDRFDQV